MSLFGTRIADAEVSERGAYFDPGKFLVQVDVVKLIEGRKGGHFFIVEADVLESTTDKSPAGSHRTWVVNLDKDAAPGNVKKFFMAALDLSENEVTEDVAESAIATQNPLQGRLVALEVVVTETQKKTPFSLHLWKAVPDTFQARAAKLRETVGLPPF